MATRNCAGKTSGTFSFMFGIGKKDTKKEEVQEEVVKATKKSSHVPAGDTSNDVEPKTKRDTIMNRLLAETQTPPSEGDIIEGVVIAIDKKGVFVDLPPFGTGIIYGREYLIARDVIKKISIGDTISAKIVDPSNKDGYVELSLKEARQALIWSEAETAIASKAIFELPVKEANKGGLIIDWQGIQGFLPASQLKSEHYPRVSDGDKDAILTELRKLVGTKLAVSVITALPKEGKLIFSEKTSGDKEKTESAAKYNVGDVLEGKVTGTVDFGVFVKIEDGLEGLVHISEIDWALVDDPKTRFNVGDKVNVKIIDIKEGKISLSIKALKPNPWQEAGQKYKKDMDVKGVIIKFNRHGALASIEEGVAGLVHVSEFGSEEKLRASLELGKTYDFKITLFDAGNQKMTLSYAGAKK
ncbi:MAG: 30S ribosomal protein S1 [Candidatus Taylorbacteria bacterium CG10_big_fil_rev_8_21_14_0_10_41_48]|uniref:30S ribosomal protein S1 n=1 Tax=Candidatus Taylorbacteria bacterium CG10_big_fil_rev_8_21_14_0_10_41_48 TaxID=1975024 RepID=A0A2M8LBI2_9BACT|nr:MAG: 30S ribosomal protein S1 [Candidatus Taylorbacteria bacterium CG10_big_fil_rev_8_21_14_0_10_41_48]